MTAAYKSLLKTGKEIRLLSSFSLFLEWDQETYMPKGAADFHSQQMELISSLTHKAKTSLRFKRALSQLIDIETGTILSPHLDDLQKANLREWRRDYLNESKLPGKLVSALAKASSKGLASWADAKENDSFQTFAPRLETIISLCKEKADRIGYEDHPYDAFLSLYDQGITTKKLKTLFSQLKPFLTDLLHTLSKKKIDDSFLHGTFPLDDQKRFCHELISLMGIDPHYARLDLSHHPFCLGLHPHDVRLTTHIHTSSCMPAISAVMHEGGHALYELGLPAEHYGSPLSEFTSFGMHESQSRLWETFIGLSRPFWDFLYPKLQETFPAPFKEIDVEAFYQAINRNRPSPIRIFADEVSYILHIILRFEIELALIEGKLEVAGLPALWNKKMQELLGITPKNDREGCLQDIHWAAGLFGYFPSYALGNLYAAHFYETFKKKFPDYEERIRQGRLSCIKEFLYENIHCHGRLYTAQELVKRVSGCTLSSAPYMNYLKAKFSI